MGKGKYQKILAKEKLTYDDVLVLAKGKKIKKGGIMSGLVAIRHNGEDYLKIMDKFQYEYLLEQLQAKENS